MTKVRRHPIVYVVYALVIVALIVVALVVWAPYINEALFPYFAKFRSPPQPPPRSFLDGSPNIYRPLWNIDGFEEKGYEVGNRSGESVLRIKQRAHHPGADLREDVLRAIALDLESYGWSVAEREPEEIAAKRFYNAHPVFLAEDDLCYTHAALSDEPAQTLHECRVFLSEDGVDIIVYCRIGWAP